MEKKEKKLNSNFDVPASVDAEQQQIIADIDIDSEDSDTANLDMEDIFEMYSRRRNFTNPNKRKGLKLTTKNKKDRIKCELLNQIRNREVNGKSIRKSDIFEQAKSAGLYQRDLKAHTGCVNAVDFSPTEEWIASGGDDLKVRLWKTVDCCTATKPSLTNIMMKSTHLSNIFALRFSRRTERIYSAGNDHRLLVHDIHTRERLRTYVAFAGIYCIATHPEDDNMIAAASDDRNVYLFDLRGKEGDGLCTKLRQEGCVYWAVWNPVSHHLVAVCNEKTGLLIYDLRKDNSHYVEAGAITKRAICADWSPSGDSIFCAISRSSPVCFNLNSSEYVKFNDPNYSNICTVKSCSFAGSDYMITGSDDWNIYVWKKPQNWDEPVVDRAHAVLRGHRSIVNHVRFGERSNLLLSCGVEKIVKCWSTLPLTDSYINPRQRDRLSSYRLLPYLELLNPNSNNSDTEEDLSTLHRFDYYYEMQNTSNRRQREAAVANSDSSDSSDISNIDVDFLFSSTHNLDNEDMDEDGNDQESFLSEITSGLHSPSPDLDLRPSSQIEFSSRKGPADPEQMEVENRQHWTD